MSSFHKSTTFTAGRSKRNVTRLDQGITSKKRKLGDFQSNFDLNNLDVSSDVLRFLKEGIARKKSVSKQLTVERLPMLGESSSFGENKVALSRNKNITRDESSGSNGFNSLFDIAVAAKKISNDRIMSKINKGVNKDAPFEYKNHKEIEVSLIGKTFQSLLVGVEHKIDIITHR